MMFGLRSSLGTLTDIGLRLVRNLSFRGLRLQCIRIGNVEIPDNKRLEYSLQCIYGIGHSRAHQILSDLNMENKITKELSGRELLTLREEVLKYMIGENLRRIVQQDIQRMQDIQCYRGIRHSQGLPCRGQRTKTNARTKKGKQIAIAGKKKASR